MLTHASMGNAHKDQDPVQCPYCGFEIDSALLRNEAGGGPPEKGTLVLLIHDQRDGERCDYSDPHKCPGSRLIIRPNMQERLPGALQELFKSTEQELERIAR